MVELVWPVRKFEQFQPSLSKTPPNVIWIVVDALTAEDMSLYGYSLPTTPGLEQITKNWYVFTQAQSSFTCSVGAMPAFMSGRYPYFNQYSWFGDLMNSQDGWMNLASVLKDAGYETWWQGYISPGFYHMGFSFDHLICDQSSTIYQMLDQSWFMPRAVVIPQFPFIPWSLAEIQLFNESEEDFSLCQDLSNLKEVFVNHAEKQPFFFYYHYMGVHGYPYQQGGFLGKFLPVADGLVDAQSEKKVYGAVSPEDQNLVGKLRLRYDEGIVNQDQELNSFINYLKETGIYDSAMIIITSDHGQTFHSDYTSHCTPLISYPETHVPLLIKLPGQTEGIRVDQVVSTIDITPTILDVLGFQYPLSWFDGISLLNPKMEQNRIVFTLHSGGSDLAGMEDAAMDDKLRLIHRQQQYYLYRYQQDPQETINLFEEYRQSNDQDFLRLFSALKNFEQRTLELSQGKNVLEILPVFPQH